VDPVLAVVVAGIGGAAIGAFGSYLAVRAQLAHQDRTRWHADRRQAYGAVLKQARELHTQVSRWFFVSRVGRDHTTSYEPDPSEFDKVIEDADLIVSEDAELSLAALRQAVAETMEMYIRESWAAGDVPVAESAQQLNATIDAIGDFRQAARLDVGFERRTLWRSVRHRWRVWRNRTLG
jgi:hypothetical protein